jgi:hypothetical protein
MQNNTTPAGLTIPSPSAIRDELTAMVIRDLMSPASGDEEELSQYEGRVRERYLVGVLAPKSVSVDAEEMDELAESESGALSCQHKRQSSAWPTSGHGTHASCLWSLLIGDCWGLTP